MTNTGIGLGISLFTAWVTLPIYYPESTFIESVQITLIFTVISILRGYVVRRFFNRKHTQPIAPQAGDCCLHGVEWEYCPDCRH